jgi:hypothetical protein
MRSPFAAQTCAHRRQRVVEHSGVRVQNCLECGRVLDVQAQHGVAATDDRDGITHPSAPSRTTSDHTESGGNAMCSGVKANGEPCESDIGMDESGLCHAHQAGGPEHLARVASLGGKARMKQLDAQPIPLEEIRTIETERDAMAALDDLVQWGLTDRITQGRQKEVTNTIKVRLLAMQQDRTRRLEDELVVELAAKDARIQQLEGEVATLRGQGLRVKRAS